MAHLLLIRCRSVIHDHANQIDLLFPWSWAFVFQKSDAIPDGAAEALFFYPEIRLEGNAMYRTLSSRASLTEPQKMARNIQWLERARTGDGNWHGGGLTRQAETT